MKVFILWAGLLILVMTNTSLAHSTFNNVFPDPSADETFESTYSSADRALIASGSIMRNHSGGNNATRIMPG